MIRKFSKNFLIGHRNVGAISRSAWWLAAFIMVVIPSLNIRAIEEEGGPFLPTWKLLTDEAKRQFVAGYLHGWSDAAKVTDIAIDYVRGNPEEALDGLKRLKQLYNISGVQAEQLSEGISQFYADPENAGAPLSKAVTAARNRVIRGEIK